MPVTGDKQVAAALRELANQVGVPLGATSYAEVWAKMEFHTSVEATAEAGNMPRWGSISPSAGAPTST
jgi:hypothetical protein